MMANPRINPGGMDAKAFVGTWSASLINPQDAAKLVPSRTTVATDLSNLGYSAIAIVEA